MNEPNRFRRCTQDTSCTLTILGNPIDGDRAGVEVRGVEGRDLTWSVTDAQGREVFTHKTDQAQPVEHQSILLTRLHQECIYFRSIHQIN